MLGLKMNRLTTVLTAAGFATVLSAGGADAANLVTNGTFAGGTSTGWTATPTNFTGAPFNHATTACGTQGSCAVLNDFPNTLVSMSQTISSLAVGTTYTLTWDMESYYGCCGSATTPGAGAGIDGNSYLFAIGNNVSWLSYSETFTYTGGSNVLTFYAQANGTDTDAAFTNIALTAASAAVPEPASWALVIVGFGFVGFAARRRLAAVTA